MAFIPFVNIYQYLKICNIPFWTFFIPGINIIVLFFSPYNLARHYRCPNWSLPLAILFPVFFLPYIAFSKLQNKDKVHKFNYIKNQNDIDKIEKQLINSNSQEFIYNDTDVETTNNVFESNIDKMIVNVENTIMQDEYVYENTDNIEEKQATDIANIIPSDIDFIDDSPLDNINLNNIDALEENIVQEAKKDKEIETNYQDFKTVGPSTEAIAFGGEEKMENTSRAKVEELKCSRCGSSLVGANGFCPGCGAKL